MSTNTTFCALVIVFLMAAGHGLSQAQTIHLSGQAPVASDTLILLKPYEDARYQGTKIPVGEDARFYHTFTASGREAYELILLSELQSGAWRPVAFFADADSIAVIIKDRQSQPRGIVTGSALTDQYQAFAKQREERWMPVFMSTMQKAGALPQVQAKYLRDSLTRELLRWQFTELKNYPTPLALASLYQDVIGYREGSLYQKDLVRQYEYLAGKSPNKALLAVIKNNLDSRDAGLLGRAFPDFSLLVPGQDSIRLSERIPESRFTVLDLWSPWCGPCIKKSKDLLASYPWLQAQKVDVIGIIGGIDVVDKYQRAAAKHPYPWPVYAEIANQQSLWSKYGFANAGGGQVVIDGEGKIRAINPSVAELKSLVGF
ncbi:MAG: TlpA disulfide reductase family protein [Bacteroidota bacterium]